MRFCASVAAKNKHHCRQGGTTSQHCHVSVCKWSLSVSSKDVMGVLVETSHSYRSISILHFKKTSSCNVYLKQSSPRKLFFVCNGGMLHPVCEALVSLWHHFVSARKKEKHFLVSARTHVAFWLFSIELILTFVLKDAITMYYGKQHLRVLIGLLNGHVWVNVTLKAWEEVKKKLMLVGHVYIMIFIAQSITQQKKRKEITVKSCPCSCFRTSLATFTPS